MGAHALRSDAFWAYRDTLWSASGAAAGDALDVGCGEGRCLALS